MNTEIKIKSALQIQNSLSAFTGDLIQKLKATGRHATANAYQSTLNSLTVFTGNPNITFRDITPALMHRYEEHLLKNGLNRNSVSFYMRNLRTIINKAVARKVIPPLRENPFTCVHTGNYETEKRALNKKEIRCLSELCDSLLLPSPLLCALLYFLFDFHACGMSFIDLAFLKKSDIHHDHILYLRRKTGQMIKVKITAPMREILKYFSPMVADSPYAFPIINPREKDERKQYESALRQQNRHLKKLTKLAGIDKNVSTHVSRHSWATIAKNENITTAVISECLGHRDERTTSTYLGAFEAKKTDSASEQISTLFNSHVCFVGITDGNLPDYHVYKRKKTAQKNVRFLSGNGHVCNSKRWQR